MAEASSPAIKHPPQPDMTYAAICCHLARRISTSRTQSYSPPTSSDVFTRSHRVSVEPSHLVDDLQVAVYPLTKAHVTDLDRGSVTCRCSFWAG